MIIHDAVPYAVADNMSELIEECRCVEKECAAHGVALHLSPHLAATPHPEPMVIGDGTRHILDGYASYGS